MNYLKTCNLHIEKVNLYNYRKKLQFCFLINIWYSILFLESIFVTFNLDPVNVVLYMTFFISHGFNFGNLRPNFP